MTGEGNANFAWVQHMVHHLAPKGIAGFVLVIPRLAAELHNELPELKGFSERNLKLMVQFAHEYPNAFDPARAIG